MEELSHQYHTDFILLETLNMDISSARIREWIHDNKSVRYYVPDDVYDYIRDQDMYKGMML